MQSRSLERLPWILSIQLLLVFFAPPLALHERSLYLGDLWCMFWLIWALWVSFPILSSESRTRLIKQFVFATGVIGLAYLHGYFRPELIRALGWTDVPPGEDRFAFFREGVVGFRFLTWIMAGIWAHCWFQCIDSTNRKKWIETLGKTTSWIVISIGALAILCRLFPDLTDLLGHIYGYDPHSISWNGRAHVTFRSPNETGIALAFGTLLTVHLKSIPRTVRYSAFVLGVIGILLTESATSIVTLGLCLAISGFLRLSTRQRILALSGLISIGAVYVLLKPGHLDSLHEMTAMKFGHFHGRIQPWIVYLQIAVSRWDYLLLGTGFHSLHVDNFYICLLNRGGLLLLVSSLYVLLRPPFSFSNKSANGVAIILFLLLSSCVLDSLVFRPIVTLLFVLAIPVLTNDELDTKASLTTRT